MKAFEITDPQKDKLDFDLHDDVIFFMNNDPEFYRQSYFPVQHKFHSICEAGREINPKSLRSVVKRAYESYKSKFPMPQLKEKLEETDLDEICEKLYRQEIDYVDQQKQREH
jgi:hypothetical protein